MLARARLVSALGIVCTLLPASLGAQSPQLQWLEKPTRQTVAFPAVGWDGTRESVILYGGYRESLQLLPLDTTWQWDGARWAQRDTPTRPPAAPFGSMAHDPGRQVMVMFLSEVGETWEWDGADWTDVTPVTGPPQRAGAVIPMAYDAARQQVLLYDPLSTTLWAWNGAAWTELNTNGPSAAAASMVYDPVNQRTLVVTLNGRTYAWDGADWTQLTTTGPNAARVAGLVHDPVRNVFVMVGLRSFLFGGLGTWEFDGTSWTGPNGQGGLTDTGQAVWFDPTRGKVVMYSGEVFDDTVGGFGVLLMAEWDGTTWSRVPLEDPTNIHDHMMAYDAANARVVAHVRGTTWVWDRLRWSMASTTLSQVTRGDMAYDGARQRIILHGWNAGTSAYETWEWDGAAWLQRLPVNNPRRGAMAYDATRQEIILLAGDETWAWNGTDWTQKTPANQPAERGGRLAYDRARQRVVLFGGSLLGAPGVGGPTDETWEWDGTDWTLLSPPTSPPARWGHAMSYDRNRDRVVVFGGNGGSSFFQLGDTWEWDGVDWTQVSTPVQPSPRRTAMAFDEIRGQMVLFGGLLNDYLYGIVANDTWVYGNIVDAVGTRYGSGCPGTNGDLVLTGTARPIVPDLDFALELVHGKANAPVVYLFAAQAGSAPLPGGCEILVDLSATIALPGTTNAAGFERFALPIPGENLLIGGELVAQALVVDPSGPWGGLAFSHGLRLVFGE